MRIHPTKQAKGSHLCALNMPAHPKPLPDELLSSWLTRLAISNSTRCYSFVNSMLCYPNEIWARDIDRSAREDLLELLSIKTPTSIQQLRQMTLSYYDGKIVDNVKYDRHCQWILEIGVYHRKRKRAGLQFCPHCLKDDPLPYFRKEWRLSFVTFCERHSCLLRDCCPSCKSSIAYHRLGSFRKVFIPNMLVSTCFHCHFDLRQSKPESIDRKARGLRLIQSSMIKSTHTKHLREAVLAKSSIELYSGLANLLFLLKRPKTIALREYLVLDNELNTYTLHSDRIPSFEAEPIEARDNYMILLCTLLQDWPEYFLQACRESNTKFSDFGDHVRQERLNNRYFEANWSQGFWEQSKPRIG